MLNQSSKLQQEQQIIIVDNLKNIWLSKILFVYLHIMKKKETKKDFGYFDRYKDKNQNKPKIKKEKSEISFFSRYSD